MHEGRQMARHTSKTRTRKGESVAATIGKSVVTQVSDAFLQSKVSVMAFRHSSLSCVRMVLQLRPLEIALRIDRCKDGRLAEVTQRTARVASQCVAFGRAKFAGVETPESYMAATVFTGTCTRPGQHLSCCNGPHVPCFTLHLRS